MKTFVKQLVRTFNNANITFRHSACIFYSLLIVKFSSTAMLMSHSNFNIIKNYFTTIIHIDMLYSPNLPRLTILYGTQYLLYFYANFSITKTFICVKITNHGFVQELRCRLQNQAHFFKRRTS